MRIKKVATAKHEATKSPFLREFISKATTIPQSQLLDHLSTFPPLWPFPRGDLYHWIPLLNRFDEILETNVKKYKLKEGPQTIPWEAEDEKLVHGVLAFSRTLVEGCGNRSLYASSAFVGDLLNTTSLDILDQALRLGARLGQRYYTSRIRGAINSSTNAALLASHYNINLERVAKIASPFVRNIVTGSVSASKPTSRTTAPLLAHDLASLAKGGISPPESSSNDTGSKSKKHPPSWDEWGSISLSYYLPPASTKPVGAVTTTSTVGAPTAVAPIAVPPTTPTPNRRTTHQGVITPSPAQRRRSSTDDAPTDPFISASSASGMQTFELPFSKIKSTSMEEILRTSLPDLPQDTHYEFLQRLRVAKALVTSPETRRKMLGIRILAITNLAYVYSETTFHTRILLPDQDEPRRLQLVYQLAEMVHSGDNKSNLDKDGRGDVPRWIQTLAFGALEALAKHKTKTADVCAALSVNVNHGVLLYVIRKMIAELAAPNEDEDKYDQEAEEWRDALFSLAQYLPNTSHAGQLMAGAGIIPVLCEFLQLRTRKALRNMPRAILLLDSLVYGVNYIAFQNLANSRGLDTIVDLVSDEVQAALKEVEEGRGIPEQYRSEAVDYKISNQRQQTLRALWKFMHHMMGLSGNNTDHLLRNFIDSPKLLQAVKDVLVAAPVFGNAVWSATVSILSSFIHNEPTSYAIVHEAGLSQALLKAVGGKLEAPVKKAEDESKETGNNSGNVAVAGPSSGEAMETEVGEPSGTEQASASSTREVKEKEKSKDSEEGPRRVVHPRDHLPAQGILPSTDAMTVIPTAFGAICLNAAGLTLFQSSRALERFFEIFESPEHVRCMADTELSSVLGNQFDELVRHHPPLRDDVIDVIVEMCQRVVILGRKVAEETGAGAKVWMDDGKGGTIVAGGRRALVGSNATSLSGTGSSEEGMAITGSKCEEEDIEMTDADPMVPTPVAPREQEPDGSPKGEIVYLGEVIDDDETPADGSKQPPSIATYIDVVARFLEAFLQNSAHSKDFIKRGGLDTLLEVYSLPSLPYDFATKHANNSLSRALHILCDNNSQPALNAILKHAQNAINGLEPLLSHTRKEGYFAPLTNSSCSVDILPPRLQAGAPRFGDDRSVMDGDEEAERQAIENVKANGTKLVKSLVTVHAFAVLLSDIFIQPMFNIRTVMPMFQSISSHTEYESLIPRLGALHRICVWEEILMQKSIPDIWNEATKVKGGVSIPVNAVAEGEAATAAIVGANPNVASTTIVPTSSDSQNTSLTPASKDVSKDPKEAEREVVERDGKTPYFRNVKTLRFLISQIPSSITPFFQGLAKSLFPRRSPDMYHKQHAFKIGESIADVMLQHLTWKRLETSDSITDKYGYWIVMLSSISSLLLEDRPTAQVITTTLINFKQLGGLKAVTDILVIFWHEVESLPTTLQDEGGALSKEDHQKMVHAYGGIKVILSLIANITSYKSVMEATQTTYLQSRDRDKDKPDYFNPSQLLVELRHAVMPTVHAMWEAQFLDKASCSIVKSIIDILGIVLKADGEGAAFLRKDAIGRPPSLLSWRSMEPNEEKLQSIMDMGFPRQEAQSALLRSNGEATHAAEWLLSQRTTRSHRESQESTSSSRPQTADSSAGSEDGTDVDVTREESIPTLEDEASEISHTTATAASSLPVPEVNLPQSESVVIVAEEPMPMNIDDAPASSSTQALATVIDPGPSREPTTQEKGKTKEDDTPVIVTVDDLNDLRTAVRDNLINRALDILQVHPDVTFELASLINNAFSKGQENSEAKKEVASTIVQSLMSLQLDEDFRPHGRTISATAHLLGLILQNQEFYEACLEDLKTQVPVLVGFLKIYPGEPAPWVANILLVVEKILAEASQPRQVKFVPGSIDQQPPSPIVELTDYTISVEDTGLLFEAIMVVVPLIERDEVLALAVTRVLAIITRNRALAIRMTETDYLQQLFHMFKRHAGLNTTRIQNCMMYILRHIIEDRDTIKSVMKAEIRSWFQARGSRQIDINAYIRHTSHLVLRDPEAYVEVTNEICRLVRYDANLRSLSQQIAIKEPDTPKPEVEEPENTEEKKPDTAEAMEKQKGKEPEDKEMMDKPKLTTEMKAPGVEKPDGVIHFLLCELLQWKDIEDIETPVTAKDGDVEMKNTDVLASPDTAGAAPASTIVPLAVPTAGEPAPSSSTTPPKPEKPDFRAEQHPIYIYRCFLIQCLTELLSCYNRSKIEFINFSRKSQPREAITPSKPRSAVLNYLLYDLIPMGSLLQQEDIAYKKKSTISNWAISAVVALASQTGESSKDGEEPELLFVRKFVLESMLKAFKDATTSNEPLDARYARMLSLADLFYRMLAVRPNHGGGANSNILSEKSQEQIARIMFEKNFIGALTNSLADIDFNFPSARRVIKYILRPLKVLSKTAVDLSETSDITNLPGVTDEDEISIASSLSDIDDMREETPDLYRNSALGIFEGGEMADDDQSDYDEDDEEGVLYEHEMDYDEEEDEIESDSEISEEEDVPDEEMGVQIVLEGHEHHHHHHHHHHHEDEGSEDEDEDMSEDEMDEDEEGDEVEIIDELAEIGQVVYENPGEDDDWQSGDSEGERDHDEEEILVEEPMDSIIRAMATEEVHDEMDDERDDGFVDDEGEDEDEDDEDDELDEEDALIHAEMDEEEEFDSATQWGWAEDPGDAPMMARAGRPARGGWYTLGGAPRGEIDPNFRIMRLGGAGTRTAEDNSVNPLLQRSNSEQGGQRHPHRQDLATNWVEDGALAGSSAVTMLNTLMSFVARAHGGAPMGNFRFTASPALIPGMHAAGEFGPREIRAMFGNRRLQPEQPRYHREDPQTIVNNFIPIVTIGRWQEEARLIHGSTYADKASKIVNALLVLLVPPAIEEEARKEKERLEEKKKKEEEERIAREKAEAEEKAKKEAEERETAERAAEVAEAARVAQQAEVQESEIAEGQPGDAMEGVEATQPSGEGEAGPSTTQQPRAVVMIRGREMDITGMDIDPGFLEALPEDLREEVLTNHIRERRAAAASTNQTSEISREFLEALPDDIRVELLAQEANERRSRERDAARQRAAANGQAPTGPVEIDLASFLATLDPGLRQTVLLEQDDESLAQLPEAIIAEANALRGDRRLHQYTDIPGIQRVRAEVEAAKPSKKPVRKTTVQMLDKAGIATLLRLMFMPQGNTARSTLHDILLHVCENRQNRSEVLNTLLSILQEGSTDIAAVERVFAQLSVRAKQTNITTTKTPTKRTNTGPAPLIQSSTEVSPLMVSQQCLQALYWLVNYNEHIPSYFLSEHDISTGLKRATSKKGKGKEITPPKSSKYALNTLLSLLDRKMITESSSVMDQLSGLLSEITRPLTILKKEKKRQEEEKANKTASAEAGGSGAGGEEAPTEGVATANEPMATTEEQAVEGTAKEGSKDTKEEESPKKTRNLVPPVVPESNLKLVVKILVARECSGKTFRETLTTMQNLSAIPGAREVFGRELIEQAKILGDMIYSHLQELVEQIHVAANGTEVQGMALSKFSPASSDQAKLLRVLTALDYLFDPKREKKDKPEEGKKEEEKKEETEKPEAEIFARLYDSKTFSSLWGKLSDCLTAIHEREDMLHVATILLPLIEALMVVCKNSGMKETPLRDKRNQTPRLQSPPIESGMEHLFFRFTEDHRKILNQMVRNNPKLMSGSFSLLVNNPKVLDFDNKRNYFNRRLHARNANTREQPPPLQLSVRRDQVFLDSFKSMYFKSADEIKYAKLSIRFNGEEGVDAGGVTREWFQVLARQMFNPDYALFTPVASDRTTFHPNRTSWINAEHLSFFKFIGRIIGKALYEGRVLDCHFSRAVYKKMLGKNVSLKDMETLDLDYYKSLVWMLENDITDIITETFSIEANDYGDKKIIDLVLPNGRNTPVTEENKHEYVKLMVEYKLLLSVQEQMEHFLKGFHDIVPADLVAIFNEQELELLISGLPDIDVDDWRNNSEYHNYSASSPQIQWFWRAVRSFDKEERAKLLQFATGTSKVPLNGFKELEGMNGFSKFNIHRDYGSKDRLPSSHTCFNQIDLPEYDSYENLRHNLFTAITQGADHFGFA